MNNIGEEVTRLYAKELAVKPQKNAGYKPITIMEMTVVGIVIISVLSVSLLFVYYWTKYIYIQQEIYAQESRLEKEYQRRADLGAKLIRISKDYAQHEQNVLKYISDSRTLKKSAEKLYESLAGSNGAEAGKTLSRLMALAEQYPDLKATKSFQLLMEMNEITENRIALARDKYIALICEYNAGLQSFPDNMFNLILRFENMEFYRAEEDSVQVPVIYNSGLLEKEGK